MYSPQDSPEAKKGDKRSLTVFLSDLAKASEKAWKKYLAFSSNCLRFSFMILSA